MPSEVIRVVGNYDNALGTTDAASAGSVTEKLIEARPALRTGEVLEFVPGVIVTQHSGDGKANQYFLRGFNLDHGTDFATWVDEVPVNMRTHAHGQGYTDLNFLIPELVRRIDYRKGPYYAEEGDFSSAGAAHMRLVDRLDKGIASATIGQDGYARGLLADSIALAGGNLLYAVEAAHNDGPWDVPENLRKFNGMLRWSARNGDVDWHLTGMAYESQWIATDQIPQRVVSQGLVDRFGSLNPSDGGKTSRYALSGDVGLPLGDGRFNANAYALRSRLDLFSDFTYFLDDPVHGDQFEQAESRTMLGANLRYEAPMQLAGFATQNAIGLQLRHDRLDPVGLYATQDRTRLATTREDRVGEGSAGLWFESRTEWSSWLRSVLGLRYDYYDFDVASDNPANSGSTHDGIASPKLSLVFGPWAKTEVFLNYGQGFHSNDARGTVQTVVPGSGEAASPVTPLVKSRGAEIGFKTEWQPGLQSSLSVWRLDLDSELVFAGDAGETEPSRPSHRSGVEWNSHYIARPWLRFDLDLAWSKARYADTAPEGDHIPGSIEQVASFGATLDRLGPWSGEFQLRYFGPRPLIEDDSVRSDATTLAYLRVGYAFDADTRLMLDVFNLFDTKASDIDYYYASRLPGEPVQGVEDVHFHPVEPRSFRLTLVRRF